MSNIIYNAQKERGRSVHARKSTSTRELNIPILVEGE